MCRLMAADELRRHIYIFTSSPRCVAKPREGHLPWTIESLFGVYNRKHILHPRKPPSIDSTNKATLWSANKVHWRATFQDQPSQSVVRRRCQQRRAQERCALQRSRLGQPDPFLLRQLAQAAGMEAKVQIDKGPCSCQGLAGGP